MHGCTDSNQRRLLNLVCKINLSESTTILRNYYSAIVRVTEVAEPCRWDGHVNISAVPRNPVIVRRGGKHKRVRIRQDVHDASCRSYCGTYIWHLKSFGAIFARNRQKKPFLPFLNDIDPAVV